MPGDRTLTALPEAAHPPTASHDSLVTQTLAFGLDPAASPPAVTVGAGRYEFGEEIARGGMGVILRAADAVLGRGVAVKVLHDKYAPDSAAAARFADEARIAAQLQHPGIPPVHDLGTLPDGRPFLAMKLIKGRTLEALLAERPDPAADRGRFLAAFEQVCQAVAFAHANRVIHRDLKPANVMVGAFGEVQVMDWGLAKVLADDVPPAGGDPGATADSGGVVSFRDSDGTFTQAGAVLGTPAYMPPEQAIGAVGKVDTRSDVFGLGGVLAVILTGHPPFAAASAETTRLLAAQGKLDDCFARLDDCGADPEWVGLCKRCLASDPAARPADAGEVAAAVAALRAEADERARRAELDRVKADADRAAAVVQAAEQRKRRHAQAALGLAFTALVALGVAFGWWADREASRREADERDRDAAAQAESRERESKATWEAERAIAEANDRVTRARIAVHDPILWSEARAAARQAVDRSGAAGVPADHSRAARELADVAEQGERNRLLVATLIEIHAGMGDDIDVFGNQDFPRTDARYSKAFSDFGADLRTMPPDRSAALLGSLAGDRAVEVAAAIDNWGYVRRAVTGTLSDTTKLFAVTRRLDPDPTRNRIREVIASGNRDALEALPRLVDPAVQPPETVNTVASHVFRSLPAEKYEAAGRLLQAAHMLHPNHFQVAHNTAWYFNWRGQHARALPYAAAAVAIRRHSAAAWQAYANALAGDGRAAEAVVAYRRAAALAPGTGYCRLRVVQLLATLGEIQPARAAAADAIRAYEAASPTYKRHPWAQNQLGELYLVVGERGRAEAAFRDALHLDPNNGAARAALARLLEGRGQPLAEPTRIRLSGLGYSVGYLPDGRLLSTDSTGTVSLHGQNANGPPVVFTAPATSGGARPLCLRHDPTSPNGMEVVAGYKDGKIRFWVPGTAEAVMVLDTRSKGVLGLAAPLGADRVFASVEDGVIQVWDVRRRQVTQTLTGLGPPLMDVAVRPGGNQVASVGGRDLLIWDLQAGTRQLLSGVVAGHALAYSPVGDTLAVSGPGGAIGLWNPDTGGRTRVLKGHTDEAVIGMAFAPGGRVLASGGHDKTIRLWDVQTGELLHTFDGHTAYVRQVAFSPDGRTIASASWDQSVGLWEVPPHVRPLIPTTRPTAPPPRSVRKDSP